MVRKCTFLLIFFINFSLYAFDHKEFLLPWKDLIVEAFQNEIQNYKHRQGFALIDKEKANTPKERKSCDRYIKYLEQCIKNLELGKENVQKEYRKSGLRSY